MRFPMAMHANYITKDIGFCTSEELANYPNLDIKCRSIASKSINDHSAYIFFRTTEEYKKTLNARKKILKQSEEDYMLNLNLPPLRIRHNAKDLLLHCKKCNEVSNPQFKIELHFLRESHILTKEEFLNSICDYNVTFQAVEFKCNICNKKHYSKNVLFVSKSIDESAIHYKEPIIFKDKNKISISTFGTIVTSYNNSIQYKEINTRLTINTDTGQTWLLAPIDFKTKKVVKELWRIPNNFINMTYSSFYRHKTDLLNLKKEVLYKVYSAVRTNLKNKLKYPILDFNISDEKQLPELHVVNATLIGIITFNRFPYLKPKDMHNFIINSSPYILSKIGKIKNDNHTPINSLIEIFNLPNKKSIRRLLTADVSNCLSLNYFKQIFKDINVLTNYIKLTSSNPYTNYNCSYTSYDYNRRNKVKKMIKLLIVSSSETVVVNKLLAFKHNPMSNIIDMANMYEKIKSKQIDYEINTKLSINEIHDELTLIYNKIRHENMTINYSDKELQLNDSIDNLKFNLAKDTHELVEIGTKMHICVGSYANSALEKRINIVSVSKDDKYIGCLEIKNNCIVQAKGHMNSRIDKVTLKSIIDWSNKNNFKIDTYDISDNIQQEISQENFEEVIPGRIDYAMVF